MEILVLFLSACQTHILSFPAFLDAAVGVGTDGAQRCKFGSAGSPRAP